MCSLTLLNVRRLRCWAVESGQHHLESSGNNRANLEMSFCTRLTNLKSSVGCFFVLIAMIMIGAVSSPATAEEGFSGPSFRKGLWHFVRTLELVAHRKTKYRLQEREMTRCVDPTVAMKATFSSPSVGNCVTATPEKSNNKYTFANRCDFMRPGN